jgi:O-acetyl-ADP-ribose deacetylase (regulator of RNase III)
MWGGTGGTRIFNLMTQEGDHGHGSRPGKATVANVNHALRKLRHAIETEGITSLAIPAIATGVGGLNWDDVNVVVESQLGDMEIPIYVYTVYQKGVQADEPEVAAAT